MRRIAATLLLWVVACAGTPPQQAGGPIDWAQVDAHWSLHVVTLDADGAERVTRIWLAVEGGQGALRTGDSRWWENLQRDPACRIRVGDADYPVRAVFATEHEDKARIDDAFAEKYGWQESLLFWDERGDTHENYAWLHAPEAP